MKPLSDISRNLLITVMLALAGVMSCHGETPVTRMSRVLAALKENPHDVKTLVEAGQTYLDLCDYDGSRRVATQLEDIACQGADSVSSMFYAKLLSGCADIMSGNHDKALAELNRALMIAENKSLTVEGAKANNAIAFCYVNFDLDFSGGLDKYSLALDAARKSGSRQMVAVVLNNIADAYLWRHDFSGTRFAEEALNISRNADDNYGILVSTLNLAHFMCYYPSMLDKVPAMLRKARDIQSEYGHLPDGEIDIVEARYHISCDDNHRAVEILDKALYGSSSSQPPLLRVRMLLYYGWALTVDGRYNDAIDAYEEALSIIAETGFYAYSLQATSGVAYCYELMDDTRNALKYLRMYQNRMDSLWISEQCAVLTRYRVQNEALLNETKLERQNSELIARHKYIIVLSAIGLMLLAVVILLCYFYRRKKSLVKAIVAREKESMLRERLLRQALDEAKAEIAGMSGKNSAPAAIAEEKIEQLMVSFNEFMSDRHAYKDPEISIRSVAEELHTNRTYLSQAINRTFGKSFPQVLAEYRVRAAIGMMSDPACSLPLKAIAAEVGFSSPSVFFTTFRNVVGMTPSAYRDSIDC